MKRTDKRVKVEHPEQAQTRLFDNSSPNSLGLMNRVEVAAIFSVDPRTVDNWVSRRQIPFIRFNKRTMFSRDALREWLLKKEFRPR